MHPKLRQLEKQLRPSPLSKIDDPLLAAHGVSLCLKRDDLLHPIISGNKWRKLKYLLDHALSVNADTLVSMGGAYSNHLHALAYAGKALGMKTIGLVRGEALATPTLQDLHTFGMDIRFVSRSDYRALRNIKNWADLPNWQAGQYWLPEGGAQAMALRGVGEIWAEIGLPFDWLCVPCGTATTLAGLALAAPEPVTVLGFAALKNASFLNGDVRQLLDKPLSNWHINLDYHFGGFAKTNPALLAFIERFQNRTGIMLEPLYTGKMLYGIYDLVAKRHFKPGTRLVALHTGGLQGNRGFTHDAKSIGT